MIKLNSLCHRGNKNIENGTYSGQSRPVSGSPDQLELAQVFDIPLPLYKRLWVDPLNFRWITTFIWAVGVGVTFGIMGDFSMFYMFLEREFDSSVTELSELLTSLIFCQFLEWVCSCLETYSESQYDMTFHRFSSGPDIHAVKLFYHLMQLKNDGEQAQTIKARTEKDVTSHI